MFTKILSYRYKDKNIVPNGTKSLPDIDQHLGSGGTFHSVIAIFPEKNVSIAIIHNEGGNIVPIGYVLTKLGKIFIPKE